MAHQLTLSYLVENFGVVVGLVLIWRGLWHLLDLVDKYILNGDTFITSVLGIIIGLIILYVPDKDLKELKKL